MTTGMLVGLILLFSGYVLLAFLAVQLVKLRKRANLVYPHGLSRLAQRKDLEKLEQHAYDGFFPAGDIDLNQLAKSAVSQAGLTGKTQKEIDLIDELADYSELALLNAKCIVSLRRVDPPDVAYILFHRIWAENSADLTAELDARWLMSSALTFVDHGKNEHQRHMGLSVFLTMGFMKLYESEHVRYGHAKDQPSKTKPFKDRLFLDIEPYKIHGGDLDQNIMVRLFEVAQADPITEPLMMEILNRLNASDETIFSRFKLMRKKQVLRKQRRIARESSD